MILELERFNEKILSSSTYYEALNYVANYVQNFLHKLLGEFKLPISVDDVLEKLGISFSMDGLFEDFKCPVSIFFDDDPYIISSVDNLHVSQLNWFKLKCIAKYILKSNDIIDGKKHIFVSPELLLTTSEETLANLIAMELMLPYSQSMNFLLENQFIEKLNFKKIWLKYGESAIGYCIEMEYPVQRKTFAYYHLLEVLEAKFSLQLIDASKYNEFQEYLFSFSELEFINSSPETGNIVLSREDLSFPQGHPIKSLPTTEGEMYMKTTLFSIDMFGSNDN